MSESIDSICKVLLKKNVLRPQDYWYVHYRRLEVLEKGKSTIFEKGTKDQIDTFRLQIGMLTESPILDNISIVRALECNFK